MDTYSMLIDGRAVRVAEQDDVINPAKGEPFATVPRGTKAHVHDAVGAASRAYKTWRKDEAFRRQKLTECAAAIQARVQDIGKILSLEQGKPLQAAVGEVFGASIWFSYYANYRPTPEVLQDDADKRIEVVRKSLGVVAAITPWNFPVALVVWKLAPALAAGCSIVVKPAIEAPLAARTLCGLSADAGLPPGLVNCLTGDGPAIGEALATHPGVAKVAFTGSRRVAEQIAAWAAPRLKVLTLELGGHGPMVVLPDADLDLVTEVVLVQGYANAGQACYSVNRVIAPPSIAAEIAERLERGITSLRLGPMATERGLRRHHELLEDARSAGARVVEGVAGDARRAAPAVVTGAKPGVRILEEEPFTPIVAVIEAEDTAAALAEANRPDYGLVGYVCGRDLRATLEAAQSLQCGTVVVNGWRVVVPYAPYAGWRGSGVGTELGRPGLEAFLRWQHLRVLA
jgi:acyl-CoA reductase-like NAD-dependent aldehyde dehydrogenase